MANDILIKNKSVEFLAKQHDSDKIHYILWRRNKREYVQKLMMI